MKNKPKTALILIFLSLLLTNPLAVFPQNKYFEREIAPGVKHIHLINSQIPLNVNILEVDLYNFGLGVSPALAWDTPGRLERLSSICRRNRALAGINGTFFSRGGVPVGYIMIDEKIVFKSDISRTSLGITNLGDVVFGFFKPRLEVRIEGKRSFFLIEGVNRPRPSSGIILYTPCYGQRTRTNLFGREIVVRKGSQGDYVSDIVDGNAPIPRDGYVISLSGRKLRVGEWLYLGARVSIDFYIAEKWSDVVHLITGGPLLVSNHKVAVNAWEEGFRGRITLANPRSAVGVTKENKLLLVVVDGRQPGLSMGLSFRSLANLMVKLGAQVAMGLDSGGSSGMWIKGRIVNFPSDGKERAISNALLLVKR